MNYFEYILWQIGCFFICVLSNCFTGMNIFTALIFHLLLIVELSPPAAETNLGK